MKLPKRGSKTYRLFLWILTTLLLVILSLMILKTETRFFSFGDFSHYWAAGHLIVTGQNPYDPELIAKLQTEIGQTLDPLKPVAAMLYPPWTLPLLIPFGLIPYKFSRIIWLIFHIGVLIYCVDQIWTVYKGPRKKLWMVWAFVLVFFPTIFVLAIGHIDPLFILCVVMFGSFVSDSNPSGMKDFITGTFLLLAAIKIHLLYLFLLAVFIWILERRRWKILLGAIFSVCVSTFIAILINPDVLGQYYELMTNYPLSAWVTPTIGGMLRAIFGAEKFWLQFVPPLFGIIWLLYYWNNNKKNWEWINHLPLIVFVSVLTTAYGWSWDYIVLLLPLLLGLNMLIKTGDQNRLRLMLIFFGAINLVAFLLQSRFLDLNDGWNFWYTPILLIWYLIANRTYSPKITEQLLIGKEFL